MFTKEARASKLIHGLAVAQAAIAMVSLVSLSVPATALAFRDDGGTITIHKTVVGGPDAGHPEDFSFTYKKGSTTTGPIQFNANGVNTLTHLANGTYTIQEASVANYTATYSDNNDNNNHNDTGCQQEVNDNHSYDCYIRNTYTPPAPTTGTIEITKYACPEGTTVTRLHNGVGGTIPNGCTPESGVTFGYVHGDQTDANAPYPELSESLTAGGTTGGNGILDITDLLSAGRYLIEETDSNNQRLPDSAVLGLYCQGDGDTSGTNDNQELTFVPAGGTTSCVAYDLAPAQPQVCTFVSDDTTYESDATNPTLHASVPVPIPYNPGWTATIADSVTWIWGELLSDIDAQTDKTEAFTKYFTVSGAASNVSFQVAADNGFVVKLNDTTISDQSANQNSFQNVYTLSPAELTAFNGVLHTDGSTNTLEIDVTNTGVPGSTAQSNPAGLLYNLSITAPTCGVTAPPPPPGPADGHLTVIKHVDNSAGGTKAADDFVIDVSSGDTVVKSGPGAEAPGTTYDLPSDTTYVVSEKNPDPSYTTTYSGNCDALGTIGLGENETASCTVTNTFVPPPSCKIVSDSSTQVEGHDAVVQSFIHSSWTHLLDALGASWIWGEQGVTDPTTDTTEVFTKVVDITGAPTSVTVDLAADNGYDLTVNGNDVANQLGAEHNYEGTTTITVPTSDLISGNNVFTFTVKNFAMSGGTDQTNPAGLDYVINVNGSSCDQPPVATVIATKIVCPTTASLPDLNGASHDTNATTASDFLAAHKECHAEPGWQFESADQNGGDAGNAFTGPAGAPYVLSGQTGSDGSVAISVPIDNGITSLHMREVLQSGFIPFTYDAASSTPNGNPNSAQFSCTGDGLNYDNWEWINNPQAGQTYYCVAWNVPTAAPAPSFVQVHILKYLDNGDNSIVPASGNLPAFPMVSSWSATNIGTSNGSYTLNSSGYGTTTPYAADTSEMSTPADYATNEVTDEGSIVLPNSNSCNEETAGDYYLEGYKTGDTLASAEGAALSQTSPNFTDLNADKYVIVVNGQCAQNGGGEPTNTSETIVVKAENLGNDVSDLSKWFFVDDQAPGFDIDNSKGSFVDGPATAPLGDGSAQISATTAQGIILDSLQFIGTQLSSISSLSYSTYRSAGDSALALALQFDIDADTTDGDHSYQGRLVYEPYYTHTVTDDTWQTWNPMDDSTSGGHGNWWFSNTTLANVSGCKQTTPCTWTQILTAFPNIGITGSTGFKAGSNWSSDFTGNVDDFVIATTSGSNTNTETFNFEPTTPAPQSFGGPAIITTGSTPGTGGGPSGPTPSVEGASTSTPPTCGPLLTDYLKKGWKNDPDQVKALQTFLAGNLGINLPATGFFGKLTFNAVKAFQKAQWQDVLQPWFGHPGSGITGQNTPTGFVYQTTKWEINNLYCPGSEAFPTPLN